MSALAKIHIAKKELNLHDDDYRAILQRVTGQSSAKGLSIAQTGAVIDEFKRLGWKPSIIKGGKKAPKDAPSAGVASTSPVSQGRRNIAEFESANKARALWVSLWQLGVIDDSSEAALEAFGKRQLKVDRLIWAERQQMFKLIEALKAMATRHGWSQNMTGYKSPTILKIRLIQAQCRLLELARPEHLHTLDYPQLEKLAAEYGQMIWAKKAPFAGSASTSPSAIGRR